MPQQYDVDGLPIPPSDQEQTASGKRLRALMILLSASKGGVLTKDEIRDCIESFSDEEQEQLSHDEKCLAAVTKLLLEKGILTPDELDQKIAEIRNRTSPKL